ncbi:hypothetical protein ACFLU5_14595 [Bacteroidota bacterium]
MKKLWMLFLILPFIIDCEKPYEPVEPELWGVIPGKYNGIIKWLNDQNDHNFTDQYAVNAEASVKYVRESLYSIEFEKSDSFQLPKLNLEVKQAIFDYEDEWGGLCSRADFELEKNSYFITAPGFTINFDNEFNRFKYYIYGFGRKVTLLLIMKSLPPDSIYFIQYYGDIDLW